MSQTTEPATAIRTSDNQLFCCKSIDKLISESEAPGQRLQKTLGPWSLTALGIGAVIGSGIFVLTGTAAAGEYFQAPSILHAQVLDIIVNFLRGGGTAAVLMHGRPAAGPSIAISFFLVNGEPGRGPRLHTHDYDEVVYVIEGQSTWTVGDTVREARPGDILIVRAGEPHKFVNSGAGVLRQIDIHLNPSFETRWLED